MSDHAESLKPKIRRLHESMSRLASEKRAEQLLQIVYRPGWTTPAEAQLVHAMLDALTQHVEAVETTHRALIAAAERIGQS
jgi:hypothetical protein